jgi:hypothetical protein
MGDSFGIHRYMLSFRRAMTAKTGERKSAREERGYLESRKQDKRLAKNEPSGNMPMSRRDNHYLRARFVLRNPCKGASNDYIDALIHRTAAAIDDRMEEDA